MITHKKMIFNFFLLTLLSMLVSCVCLAQTTAINPSCRCHKGQVDPYEVPSEFSFGAFKGSCVDSCRFRPVRILKPSSGKPYIANLLHFGYFYKTQLSLQFIERVDIGFEEFSPNVFHVFLRFHFSRPISLEPQITSKSHGKANRKNRLTRSIVISPEGVTRANADYTFLEAYQGHYLNVVRVLSGAEMTRQTNSKGNRVQFYALNLEFVMVRSLFEYLILESAKNDYNSLYDLLSNNCATMIYDGLKSLNLRSFHSLFLPKLDRALAALSINAPFGTLMTLRGHDLIR